VKKKKKYISFSVTITQILLVLIMIQEYVRLESMVKMRPKFASLQLLASLRIQSNKP